MSRIGTDVVRGEPTFEFLAKPTAFLTPVPISFENGIPPSQISLVPKALPRPSSLPVWVHRAAQDRAALELCTAGFGDRLRRHSSAASLRTKRRSLPRAELALARVRALNFAPISRILVKIEPGGPTPDTPDTDAIDLREIAVRCRGIKVAK
jgi:hypothetical protein